MSQSRAATAAATPVQPLAVSVPEAATMLGISENVAWALLRSGDLVGFKVGRRRLVPVSSVEAYVEDKVAQASGATGRRAR